MIDITLKPQHQNQLIGFCAQLDRLKSLEATNSLHPAWLLSGQRGIGKATFAHHLVRYFLADSTDNPAFYSMLIEQGAHPNLLVLEKMMDEDGKLESEIKIDQVRKLMNFARQSPAIPGWRIVIIDAIDEMNRNAANSLLKILEEPPQKFLFLMVCHSMGSLLPTIRSRCSVLNMPSLTLDDLKRSEINIDPLVFHAAGNSLGQALSLKALDLEDFAQTLHGIISDLHQGRTSKLTAYISSLDKKDPQIYLIPNILQWFAREMVLCVNGLSSNPFVNKSRTLKAPHHWSQAEQMLNHYFHLAKHTHPDPIHLIQGALLIMNHPEIVHLEQLA